MKYSVLLLICIVSFNCLNASDYKLQKTDSVPENQVFWQDLITPDIKVSKEFYKALFGWTYTEKNIKGYKYAVIYNKDQIIGGMIEVPNTQSSTWISSLPLEPSILNKRIKLAVSNGAKLAVKPLKVAGLGKQVIFEEPQGSIFSLTSKNSLNSNRIQYDAVNSWMGIELWSDDVEKAKIFYESTFGVTTEQVSNDDKPYWYFKNGNQILAAMVQNPVTNQGSQWVPYVNVASPINLVTETKNAGGYVVLSPTKTIRNGSLGIIQDPHGAIIAIQQNK